MTVSVWARAVGAAVGALGLFMLGIVLGLLGAQWLIGLFQ